MSEEKVKSTNLHVAAPLCGQLGTIYPLAVKISRESHRGKMARINSMSLRPILHYNCMFIQHLKPTSGGGSGEGGIRTHGTVSRTRDFQSRSFSHSDTSPEVFVIRSSVIRRWSIRFHGVGLLSALDTPPAHLSYSRTPAGKVESCRLLGCRL